MVYSQKSSTIVLLNKVKDGTVCHIECISDESTYLILYFIQIQGHWTTQILHDRVNSYRVTLPGVPKNLGCFYLERFNLDFEISYHKIFVQYQAK